MGPLHTDCLVLFDGTGTMRYANVVADGARRPRAQDLFARTMPELLVLADAGKELTARDGHRYRLERLVGEAGEDGILARVSPPAFPFDWLDGDDPALASAISLGQKLARSFLPMSIVGEAGSRVEELARHIHEGAGRAGAFWVGASCVGHVSTPSLSSGSARATLFVEDVDRLAPEVQNRLANEGASSGVGLIVTTRLDLSTLVRAGVVERKLFELVRSSSIALPPLRERADRRALLERAAAAAGRPLAPDAMRELEAYAFPGNVDEVWDVLCEARSRAGRLATIRSEHLPERVRRGAGPPLEGGLLGAAERAALEEAVRAESGNLSAAAKRLGVARSTLYRMLERYSVRAGAPK